MPYFTIDPDNNVQAHAVRPKQSPSAGAASFESERELSALSRNLPNARLVLIWNKLAGVKPVQKFTDRQTAVRRIWNALQMSEHVPAPEAKQNTKTASIIALLKQPAGATLKDLMAATGWQSHSVRGFISAQLSKRMGLRVTSLKRDGERVYRIRSRGQA